MYDKIHYKKKKAAAPCLLTAWEWLVNMGKTQGLDHLQNGNIAWVQSTTPKQWQTQALEILTQGTGLPIRHGRLPRRIRLGPVATQNNQRALEFRLPAVGGGRAMI